MILHFGKIMGLQRFSKTYHGQCPSKTIREAENLSTFNERYVEGNRYVEGEPRTFGYLMLYDCLGYPYFRLFNGNP